MVELRRAAVEMEASALYTLAAKYGRRALAICTVSDHVVTGEETSCRRARADLRPTWSTSRSRAALSTRGREHRLELGAAGQVVGLDDPPVRT